MSRPPHRHRHIRLTSGRARNSQNRLDNAPRKRSERSRRDVRIIAVIKGTKGADYSPATKSWISARLGKAWRQVTPADIKKSIA